ncbi:hypothetical protein NST99_07040 [Paenibacillus sp. FSL L8-0470]|uniref:hypothetical protein n=1 Tax=Paenibacillus sp. FSL L8-0470 TaxID=2954688 RepID=UPI0030FB09CB
MHTSDWIALSSAIISLLGVFATSIFSMLLWKATKRSTKAAEESAIAALASTRIAENMEDQKAKLALALKSQYLVELKRQSMDIMVELNKIKFQKLKNSRFFNKSAEPNIPPVYIAELFDAQDRYIINGAWLKLDTYLFNNWEEVEPREEYRKLKFGIDEPIHMGEVDDLLKTFREVFDMK